MANIHLGHGPAPLLNLVRFIKKTMPALRPGCVGALCSFPERDSLRTTPETKLSALLSGSCACTDSLLYEALASPTDPVLRRASARGLEGSRRRVGGSGEKLVASFFPGKSPGYTLHEPLMVSWRLPLPNSPPFPLSDDCGEQRQESAAGREHKPVPFLPSPSARQQAP